MMNKYQDLLKVNGFVLISDKGIESSGFDFNYEHEHFDGCRMAQIAPLLFAQSKLHSLIQSSLIDSASSGGNECHTPFIPHEDSQAAQMGECFAKMLFGQIPYERGTKDYCEFIDGLCRTLQRYLNKVKDGNNMKIEEARI